MRTAWQVPVSDNDTTTGGVEWSGDISGSDKGNLHGHEIDTTIYLHITPSPIGLAEAAHLVVQLEIFSVGN